MIRHFALICVCVLSLISAQCLASRNDDSRRVFTLVLDAGHGGHDNGCRGKSLKEKEVVLDVVKKAGKLIAKEFGDSVDIVYTRSNDTFIPLDRRAQIANKANADLFVSVHVNSLDRRAKGRKTISGASVYTVGLHKSDANLAVAMRENSVIELEEDFSETYQGFDPNLAESYIVFELSQNRHMEQSIKMASMVKDELVATAGRADKGVRQAGFLVLWATRMPAVLIELDFMCNPGVEKFLASQKGREKCAKAIANAFAKYYRLNKYGTANNN